MAANEVKRKKVKRMNFTLGELLNSTWNLFTNRLGLAWAVLFSGLIPVLLLTMVMAIFGLGGGLVGTMSSLAHPGLGMHRGAGGFAAGAGVGMVLGIVVGIGSYPYCLGGLMGTVGDALGTETDFSVWRFFTHGSKLYGRSFVFFLLSLVLGLVVAAVALIGGIILHYVWFVLALLWAVALYLAFGCLLFYWVPAVYLEDQGQAEALAKAFQVTFREGKWKQAVGFLLVCLLAGVVLWIVSTILDITIIGLVVGIPLMIVGPLFLEAFVLLGSFNAYNADNPPPVVPAGMAV